MKKITILLLMVLMSLMLIPQETHASVTYSYEAPSGLIVEEDLEQDFYFGYNNGFETQGYQWWYLVYQDSIYNVHGIEFFSYQMDPGASNYQEIGEIWDTESDTPKVVYFYSDGSQYYQLHMSTYGDTGEIEEVVLLDGTNKVSWEWIYMGSLTWEITIQEWTIDDVFIRNIYSDTVESPVQQFYFTEIHYKALFDANGGTMQDSIQYLYGGDTIRTPSAPFKPGYTFDGWYQLKDTTWFDYLDSIELYNTYPEQTLEEFIESEQLVVNGDFSDGTSGWNLSSASGSLSNGIYSFTPNAQYGVLRENSRTVVIGNKYYGVARYKVSTLNVQFNLQTQKTFGIHSGSGNYEIISSVQTAVTTDGRLYIIDIKKSGWTQIDVDYAYLFNITKLQSIKQYSPLYNTTFDLMSDAQIKAQMDLWVEQSQTSTRYTSFQPYSYGMNGDIIDSYITDTIIPPGIAIFDSYGLASDDYSIPQWREIISVYADMKSSYHVDVIDTYPDYFEEATLSQPISEDTYFFAKWTENPPEQRTITFDTNRGSYLAPLTVQEGYWLKRPNDPYREGYTFKGWEIYQINNGNLYRMENVLPMSDFTLTVDYDMVLKAIWEAPTPEPTDLVIPESATFIMMYWPHISIGIFILGFILQSKTTKRRKRGYRS